MRRPATLPGKPVYNNITATMVLVCVLQAAFVASRHAIVRRGRNATGCAGYAPGRSARTMIRRPCSARSLPRPPHVRAARLNHPQGLYLDTPGGRPLTSQSRAGRTSRIVAFAHSLPKWSCLAGRRHAAGNPCEKYMRNLQVNLASRFCIDYGASVKTPGSVSG